MPQNRKRAELARRAFERGVGTDAGLGPGGVLGGGSRERIGAYEVIRFIARGGWRRSTRLASRRSTARRAQAARPALDDPTLAARFIRESRIAASFDHPNIVTVFDFFEQEGAPYIAMEYLPRGSLRPGSARSSRRRSFGVLEGMLAGLAHAEEHGVAHRDLKPENVLVTGRGAVKIADFGIAKALQRARGGFTAPACGRTPAYMAPEQALGQRAARTPTSTRSA